MTDPRIVRAMIVAFLVFIGGMTIWKLFVMRDMSWFVVIGSSIAFAFYIAFLKRRQRTR